MNTSGHRSCTGPVATVLAVLLLGQRAAGSEPPPAASYYLVIYAVQDLCGDPLSSHCFATFARIDLRDDPGAGRAITLQHINWFSSQGHETGMTHGIFDAGHPVVPERGENRPTREALAAAARNGRRIFRWGPFAIQPALYARAQQQVALLEGRIPGRQVLYKAFDIGLRETSRVIALNCIHAITDIDRDLGPLRTGMAYGEEAGHRIALHLSRWIEDRSPPHPDVWRWIQEATWRPDPVPFLNIIRRDLRHDPPDLRTVNTGPHWLVRSLRPFAEQRQAPLSRLLIRHLDGGASDPG